MYRNLYIYSYKNNRKYILTVKIFFNLFVWTIGNWKNHLSLTLFMSLTSPRASKASNKTTINALIDVVQACEHPALGVWQKIFYHDQFNGIQRDVVHSILQNNDTTAIIPIGGVETISYWLPGIMNNGVSVIITPLIALLNDQVTRLKVYGISVCYVISTSQPKERDSVFHEFTRPNSVLLCHTLICYFPTSSHVFKPWSRMKLWIDLPLMRQTA